MYSIPNTSDEEILLLYGNGIGTGNITTYGLPLRYKGLYNITAYYNAQDLVKYNDVLYLCTLANIGLLPSLSLSNWEVFSSGGLNESNDATTITKGIIQLAGDLSGTSVLPTVPGLLNKADKVDTYTKVETDTLLLSRANHTGTQLSSTISDFNESLEDRVALLLKPGTNVSSIIYDDTAGTLTINVPNSNSVSVSDATTTVKGILKLTGDLGGTADLPTVPSLINKADKSTTYTKIETDNLLTTKSDTSHVHSIATTTTNGFLSNTDKVKLDAITGTNTGNQTITLTGDVTGSGTGSFVTTINQNNIRLATTSINGFLSSTDKLKLDGIATGATVNSTDVSLRDRSTHTGVQSISTITSLQSSLDSKEPTISVLSIAKGGTGSSTQSFIDLTTAQTIGGVKTFTSLPSIAIATTTTNGFLSSTDKVKLDAITGTNTGNQTITLTGDVTGSGTGSFATTINQNNIRIGTTSVAGFISTTDKTKLDSLSVSSDKVTVDVTQFFATTSSPIFMLTLPINAVVQQVSVIIDVAFNGGSPTLSIGTSGSPSKYMSSSQVDLLDVVESCYVATPNKTPLGTTENIIITYAANLATTGTVRVLLQYSIPS